MTSDDTKIYHERQRRQFCLLHSLNNLFQDKDAFTRTSLDEIAEGLVASDPRKESWIPLFKPHHNTLTGNYDVNVLIASIERKGKAVNWHDKRKGAATIDLDDESLVGLMLNLPIRRCAGLWSTRHWVAVRKINGIWYNLDSDLYMPHRFIHDNDLRRFLDDSIATGGEILLVQEY